MQGQHSHGPHLQFRVAIGAEDSLDAYMYRVADAYSYPSPRVILPLAGVRGSLSAKPEAVAAIAALCKVPAEELERRAYRLNAGARRNFFGSVVGGHHIVRGECRLCPECLREGFHHSALFDLVWNVACDRHAARLINHCPNPRCGRRLTWDRPRIDRCRCGFDLKTVEKVEACASSVQFSALVRRVAGFAGVCRPRPNGNPHNWPAELFETDLGSVMDLISLIVRHDTRNADLPGTRAPYLEELHAQFADLVGGFLEDWPNGALAYLQRNRAARMAESGKSGDLRRRFSLSANTLGYTFKQGIPPFIQELRERHLRECTYSFKHQKEMADAKWITTAGAARILSVCEDSVERLCEEGHLRFQEIETTGRKRMRALEAADVMRLNSERHALIERQEAYQRHGFSETTLTDFQRRGLLRGWAAIVRTAGNPWVYDRSEIAGLFARLRASSSAISASAAENNGPRRITLGDTRWVAETVVCILSGNLTCHYIEGAPHDHLDSYLIGRREAAFARRRRAAHQVGLSIGGASHYLRCCWWYLNYVVEQRIFTPRALENWPEGNPYPKNSRGVRFFPEDLDRFQAEFISVREIEDCNLLPKGGRVGARLKYNVDPVVPRRALSGKQFLWFRRREVAPFLTEWGWEMPPIRRFPSFELAMGEVDGDQISGRVIPATRRIGGQFK